MLVAEREERLELQKLLKESLSFKEINRRLDRNKITISREVRKYSSEADTGYPEYPYNACKIESTAGIRMCVAKNVQGRQQSILSIYQLQA
jgi:Transposase and inactivated derivatives, IS30 family